jgi:predicted  nucleic acid-binding Zn-ribbon protein
VLRNRDAARAAELGGDDPEERGPRLVARLRESALTRTRLEQIITVARLYPDTIADHGMAEAVDEMRSHIGFRAVDGETFAVSFDGADPTRVRDVTSRLAEALIADAARPNGEATAPAREAAERERLEKELGVKQTAVTSFLNKHPEFTRESQGGPPPPRPAPRPANRGNDNTLAMLERETARLQERLAQPQAHATPKEEVQAEAALVAAKSAADSELQAAQKDLADKQGKFTDEHPDVRVARERLKAATEKSKRADEAVNASLAAAQQKAALKQEDEGYIDRGALENQLKRINDEITEYKKHKAESERAPTAVMSSVVALENDWTRLAREVTDARDRLATAREAEAKAPAPESPAALARTSPLVQIDPAFVPGHEEWPGRTPIMAAGVSLAVILGLLLALLLALLDDRVYDRVDIERIGLPLLSVVPRRSASDDMVKLG